MSSINKTEHLQLNLWDGEDYLERMDVVADNKAIDEFAIKVDRELKNLKSEKANTVDVKNKLDEIMAEIEEIEDSMADTSSLQAVKKDLEELKLRVSTLSSTVSKKADTEYVDAELKKKASVTAMNNKADSIRVGKLEETIETKASKDEVNKKLNKNGDTATGIIKAYGNSQYTTGQMRNIVLSTEKPTLSRMVDGDIWLKYE